MKISSRPRALLLGLLAPSLLLASCAASALPSKVVEAFFNKQQPCDMRLIARYDAGELGLKGAVMEIIAYNQGNDCAYAVNGKTGQLVILPLAGLEASSEVVDLSARSVDVKAAVAQRDAGFDYQDMTSVAVSPDGRAVAIALQSSDYLGAGRVALFDCAADGSLALRALYRVGSQPDMLCFADSDTMLTANEGEPREGYEAGAIDPEGSVSVIRISQNKVTTLGFSRFDSPEARARLIASGVLLKKGALPSRDFEPEYICIAKGKAYIALQEANAVAVLHLGSLSMESVLPLGYTDYGRVPLDLNSADKLPRLRTHAGLLGARMPDGIASYQIGGHSYIVTANEGDGREWGSYENELKVNLKKGEQSPAGSIRAEHFPSAELAKVTLLDSTQLDGLTAGKDTIAGSRSFSIYQVIPRGMRLVFDSGSDFERVAGQALAAHYPLSGDGLGLDDRSGKKGPEPECVVIGLIEGKPHAFVGLERTGGIMVYDISVPAEARLVNYMNTRDFTVIEKHEGVSITGGDISPEGLAFVPARAGRAALLLVANEISGTIAVIQVGK